MKDVIVEVANPLEMRLKVTAEMSIGEWTEVLRKTAVDISGYYVPLAELRNAIQRGIDAITKREAVRYPEAK